MKRQVQFESPAAAQAKITQYNPCPQGTHLWNPHKRSYEQKTRGGEKRNTVQHLGRWVWARQEGQSALQLR